MQIRIFGASCTKYVSHIRTIQIFGRQSSRQSRRPIFIPSANNSIDKFTQFSVESVQPGQRIMEASQHGNLEITRVHCLSDNYSWLLRDMVTGLTAIVDPSESEPVKKAMEKSGYTKLDYIINTHHHFDHVGGNTELKRAFHSTVVGAKKDAHRIPGIDEHVEEGATWNFGSHVVQVFETPGHTSGHVSLWFEGAKAVFTGDTLFSVGCGRLFEGNAAQMHSSLSKLAKLPDDTNVYCGHEYTTSNVKFAVHVDGGNAALLEYQQKVLEARKKNEPTVPSLLGLEKAVNPFLRPHDPAIRSFLKVKPDATDEQALAAIRSAKDSF